MGISINIVDYWIWVDNPFQLPGSIFFLNIDNRALRKFDITLMTGLLENDVELKGCPV